MSTSRKQLTLAAAAAVLIAATPAPEAPYADWAVDGNHTEVNFSVKHFFTPVTGSFADYEIDLDFNAESPAESTVSVTIAAGSIDTGNERRDNHLNSADFFETESYPTITFESTEVRQLAEGRLVAVGELTIKGVTKVIELPITILGTQELPAEMSEMMGGIREVASFTAATTLDRRDFGVGVGSWAATVVVGKDVEIGIVVEANRS